MKNWIRKAAVVLSAMCLCVGSVPAVAAQTAENPLSAQGQTIPFSDEQMETVRNGGTVSSDTAPIFTGTDLPGWRGGVTLPTSFDLRAEGLTTAIGDQQISGPCWAFAATAVMESQELATDVNANFSETHLCWETYAPAERFAAYHEFFNSDKQTDVYKWGGFALSPVYSMSNWDGPAKESDYPFSVTEALPADADNVSEQHLQDALLLPRLSATATSSQRSAYIQQAKTMMITYQSALSVSYYSSGIETCYNNDTFAWYNNVANPIDHGVAIVGWDDNFDKNNFLNNETITGNGAWLIKNSWGADWGDDGYFWLSYEDKSLVMNGVYLFEPTDNYDTVYSYDESVWAASFGFGASDSQKMANVFTAEDTQLLEAASFYTNDTAVPYELNIYTQLRDPNNPTSGTLAATVTGTQTYWGYHTVKLPTAVSLTKGMTFAVVVTLKKAGTTFPLYAEARYTTDTNAAPLGKAGESFLYNSTVDEWGDLYGATIGTGTQYNYILSNFPIKAFTSDVVRVKASVDSGELPFGTTVTLSVTDSLPIYYTTDGSDPTVNGIPYTAPIAVTQAMTLKAAAKTATGYTPVTTKIYTQATTGLTSLLIKNTNHYSLSSYWTVGSDRRIRVIGSQFTLKPVSTGTITVNGQPVVSGEEIAVSIENGSLAVPITVTRDGCLPVSYTLKLTNEDPLTGDADDDGTVGTTDARLLLLHLMDKAPLADTVLERMDISNDGEVNSSDVRVLLQHVVNAA